MRLECVALDISDDMILLFFSLAICFSLSSWKQTLLPSWATAYHALSLCLGAMGFTRSGALPVSTSSATLLLLSVVPLASGACVDGDLGFGGALAALGITDESCASYIPAAAAAVLTGAVSVATCCAYPMSTIAPGYAPFGVKDQENLNKDFEKGFERLLP